MYISASKARKQGLTYQLTSKSSVGEMIETREGRITCLEYFKNERERLKKGGIRAEVVKFVDKQIALFRKFEIPSTER